MRVRYQRGPAMSGGDGDTVDEIPSCYGPARPRWRQPLTDAAVAAAALAVVAGAWSATWPTGLVAGGLLAVLLRSIDLTVATWMLAVVVSAGALAGVRGEIEVERLAPRLLGHHEGWVQVVGDPRPATGVVRVVVAVEGQRYEIWSREAAERERLAQLQGGQWIHVSGRLTRLDEVRARRVAWQHVVGQLRLHAFDATSPGSPAARSANAVRRSIERSSARLEPPHDALFRGLVIGDRRGQPDELVERFRATGLSHLTVVSGLNVALVLAVVLPVVRWFRPWARWLVTLLVLAWFVSLTRFEPSIVRAGAMAALSVTAFLLGRERAPFRLLCLAVGILVLVDPLLVHSTGFWLSVGATAGVCTVGPWLAHRLSPLGRLAAPVGITVGAQVGVALPLVATFGSIPLVSVPANLVAVPVASLVKLYGLPAALVAGWIPFAAGPLMWPCAVGVWWVDQVALVAERSEPTGWAVWAGWALLIVVLAALVARYRVADDGAPADR